MRVQFGDCVLDSETRELLHRGKPVHVSPKAFQFLEMLIENRPRALSKSEIHQRLWEGTFVSDGTLTSLLAEIRSAIGDDARQSRFIRTVHRFGYAFSGSAREEKERTPRETRTPRRAYRLYWGSREIALTEGENLLGRDPQVSIFIDHKSVSRQHARIMVEEGRVTIEDLQSKNGTRVNGAALLGAAELSNSDEIRLGSVPLQFRAFELSGSTETAGE
jgi:DNA-binding winged helix-turn-helix (wHTH) protein